MTPQHETDMPATDVSAIEAAASGAFGAVHATAAQTGEVQARISLI